MIIVILINVIGSRPQSLVTVRGQYDTFELPELVRVYLVRPSSHYALVIDQYISFSITVSDTQSKFRNYTTA